MMNVVLVGCGAMSKAWLEAARQIDRHRHRRPCRSRRRQGAGAGARIRARRRRRSEPTSTRCSTRPGPTRCSTWSFPRPGATSRFRPLPINCHLLTEKPLADSPDNARAIVEAARRAGRIHAVVQNRRYVANVRRIRRFLDSGAIGAPTSIHADFFVAPHFGGFREEMRHVLLLDMAIHTFDAARYMVERRAARASIARNGSRPTPGTGRARRRPPSSSSAAARCSPIAAAGAPTACAPAGRAPGASSASAAASSGTASTMLTRRSRAGRSAKASSTRPSRSPCRRSIRATASAAISASSRISSRAVADAAPSRRRAAPTTSRAWPWSSARSKAPRPAAGSTIAT